VFKAKIVEYPQAEAPVMRQDFTRLDFGWWAVYLPGQTMWKTKKPTVGVQADMWEWGTSRAAAWDCPITISISPSQLKKHPRCADLLEVMRRWEDVRAKNWLTPEQKDALKSVTQEHHLAVNAKGEYELVEVEDFKEVADGKVRAFMFERNGKRVVTMWHAYGEGELSLPLAGEIGKELDGEKTAVEFGKSFKLSDRIYFETAADAETVRSAFTKASVK